jgi:hypothetical protein
MTSVSQASGESKGFPQIAVCGSAISDNLEIFALRSGRPLRNED